MDHRMMTFAVVAGVALVCLPLSFQTGIEVLASGIAEKPQAAKRPAAIELYTPARLGEV